MATKRTRKRPRGLIYCKTYFMCILRGCSYFKGLYEVTLYFKQFSRDEIVVKYIF